MKSEENENGVGDFTPHPSPLTPHSRISWDCRRGMLELDLVLGAFVGFVARRTVVRPVTDLVTATRAVAAGDYGTAAGSQRISGVAPRRATGRSSLLISFINSCMPRSSSLIRSSKTNIRARIASASG